MVIITGFFVILMALMLIGLIVNIVKTQRSDKK